MSKLEKHYICAKSVETAKPVIAYGNVNKNSTVVWDIIGKLVDKAIMPAPSNPEPVEEGETSDASEPVKEGELSEAEQMRLMRVQLSLVHASQMRMEIAMRPKQQSMRPPAPRSAPNVGAGKPAAKTAVKKPTKPKMRIKTVEGNDDCALTCLVWVQDMCKNAWAPFPRPLDKGRVAEIETQVMNNAATFLHTQCGGDDGKFRETFELESEGFMNRILHREGKGSDGWFGAPEIKACTMSEEYDVRLVMNRKTDSKQTAREKGHNVPISSSVSALDGEGEVCSVHGLERTSL